MWHDDFALDAVGPLEDAAGGACGLACAVASRGSVVVPSSRLVACYGHASALASSGGSGHAAHHHHGSHHYGHNHHGHHHGSGGLGAGVIERELLELDAATGARRSSLRLPDLSLPSAVASSAHGTHGASGGGHKARDDKLRSYERARATIVSLAVSDGGGCGGGAMSGSPPPVLVAATAAGTLLVWALGATDGGFGGDVDAPVFVDEVRCIVLFSFEVDRRGPSVASVVVTA